MNKALILHIFLSFFLLQNCLKPGPFISPGGKRFVKYVILEKNSNTGNIELQLWKNQYSFVESNKKPKITKDKKYTIKFEKISYFFSNYSKQELYFFIKISTNFKGTISIFMTMQTWYSDGDTRKKSKYRTLAYGKKLADALRAQGITHIDTGLIKQPVCVKEPIVLDGDSKPENIRALMQAAKVVKDTRLLIIERTSSTDKVSITAFGETKEIDAGTSYEWTFSEAQRENLRQFIITQCQFRKFVMVECTRSWQYK